MTVDDRQRSGVIGVNVARSADRDRRISADALVSALGNWAVDKAPIYKQLAAAIERAAVAGDLLPGTRLPPERMLAERLAVSRSTVLVAFDHLKQRGWLESRQGSGTWLTRPDERAAADAANDSARSLRANAFLRSGPQAPIDLTTAALPAASVVGEALDALSASAFDALSSHGYLPGGLLELREAVAARFTAGGVPTTEAQVLVTTATQQALSLIAAMTLRAGDVALVESPTSPGILDALRAVGADIHALRTDHRGVRVDELEDRMTRLSPRVVFLIPTFHNPTGVVMPAGHRRRIAQLAERLKVPVVEDLSHAEIVIGEPPPPPIAHFGSDHVLSVGSMSKLFWGGLRVGWVRASEPFIARLTRVKAAADLGTPLLSQFVTAWLLPHADAVTEQRREMLKPRLERFTELLAARIPEWHWTPPEGGLSAWVELPRPVASAFAQVAQRHGVLVVPGPLLSSDEHHQAHLRVSFAPGLALIDEGIERLAAAWAAFGDPPAAALT
jgi:DNA-binding transcriptional MocR family regulator